VFTLLDFANLEQALHKSKLAGFIIDCQTADWDGAAGFWGAALGLAVPPSLRAVKNWVVTEALTGQRFCVVRASSRNFETAATQWS
jgi:uncharacterized protein YPO0396